MKYKTEILILFILFAVFFVVIGIHSYYFYRSSLDAFTSLTLYDANMYNTLRIPYIEPFEDNKPKLDVSLADIDFYVITMKNPERVQNIEQQMEKCRQQGTPIQIEGIDAVVGADLDVNALIKQDILSTNYSFIRNKKNEIGCYMSHIKTYETIRDKNKPGYSLILEDDFDICSDQFVQDLLTSLHHLKNHSPDFDLLYLGTILENHGEQIQDKLYTTSKSIGLEGTHAMLVNNKNASKVLGYIVPMKKAVDVAFSDLCREDKLKAFVVYPHIVKQLETMETTIGWVENFDIMNSSEQKLHSSIYNN